MAEPVDDALFADIAPHYAERAQAELIERAEFGDGAVESIEIVAQICAEVEPLFGDRDRRKHDEGCWRRHADCLASWIEQQLA